MEPKTIIIILGVILAFVGIDAIDSRIKLYKHDEIKTLEKKADRAVFFADSLSRVNERIVKEAEQSTAAYEREKQEIFNITSKIDSVLKQPVPRANVRGLTNDEKLKLLNDSFNRLDSLGAIKN